MTWTAQSAAYKKHKKDKRRFISIKSGQPISYTTKPYQLVHLHEKRKELGIRFIIYYYQTY